jgi:hypothetical protein
MCNHTRKNWKWFERGWMQSNTLPQRDTNEKVNGKAYRFW